MNECHAGFVWVHGGKRSPRKAIVRSTFKNSVLLATVTPNRRTSQLPGRQPASALANELARFDARAMTTLILFLQSAGLLVVLCEAFADWRFFPNRRRQGILERIIIATRLNVRVLVLNPLQSRYLQLTLFPESVRRL